MLNRLLCRKLSGQNLGYIDNTNIDVNQHLNKSGLHYLGVKTLAYNYLDIIDL